jgi:hypothetical protein
MLSHLVLSGAISQAPGFETWRDIGIFYWNVSGGLSIVWQAIPALATLDNDQLASDHCISSGLATCTHRIISFSRLALSRSACGPPLPTGRQLWCPRQL